jgi:hypothetical protein
MSQPSLLDWKPAPTGWRQKAPKKQARLRALLSDGTWHGQREMIAAYSHRFSAGLQNIHRGTDGNPPLHYQKKHAPEDDSVWWYRMVETEAECTMCNGKVKRPADELARMILDTRASGQTELVLDAEVLTLARAILARGRPAK